MATAPTPKLKAPAIKFDFAINAGKLADAIKAAGASKSGMLIDVPVSQINIIPGFNVRVATPDYVTHRDEIMQSIRSNGFYPTMPLAGFVAKDGDTTKLYLTGGHTRFDAVSQINADPDLPEDKEIKTVPMIVRGGDVSLEDMTVALHTENDGARLTPLELGTVVKRLLAFPNATQESIGAKLGITPRYLRDVLMLADSPATVKTAVLGGNVSSTQAISLLKTKKDKAAEAIADLVKAAAAKGKDRATAKDADESPKVKMVKTTHSVSIGTGMDIKDILKAVAGHVRATLGILNDGVSSTDGSISIAISLPDTSAGAAAEAKLAVADATKTVSEKLIEQTAAAKKPAKAPKAKPAPAAPVAAAETAPEPEVLDEVLVHIPPAVKSGADVPAGADDDDGDI